MCETAKEANATQHEETTWEQDERAAMIDISEETLIALREAPRHLPARPNGKCVHISACYRWISRGTRGVRLESIKIGGTTYTSIEALQRFGDRLTAETSRSPGTDMATPNRRKRQIEKAAQAVQERIGVLSQSTESPASAPKP